MKETNRAVLLLIVVVTGLSSCENKVEKELEHAMVLGRAGPHGKYTSNLVLLDKVWDYRDKDGRYKLRHLFKDLDFFYAAAMELRQGSSDYRWFERAMNGGLSRPGELFYIMEREYPSCPPDSDQNFLTLRAYSVASSSSIPLEGAFQGSGPAAEAFHELAPYQAVWEDALKHLHDQLRSGVLFCELEIPPPHSLNNEGPGNQRPLDKKLEEVP